MKSRRAFFKNPYQFTKKQFEQSKSGQLVISQQDFEDHVASTYSDLKQGTPLPDVAGLIKLTEPGVKFDLEEPMLGEVERFIKKARSGSAPGHNGVSCKVYKKCGLVRKFTWRSLKVVWRQDVVPLSWSKARLCLAF